VRGESGGGGAVGRWGGGAVGRWGGGAVARWRGGAVARWRGGAVARWLLRSATYTTLELPAGGARIFDVPSASAWLGEG